MIVEVGKKYRLTMPDDGQEYINIKRHQALLECYKDIVTIKEIRYSHNIHGDITKIEENGYWVSFKHLVSLHKIIKYNKELP